MKATLKESLSHALIQEDFSKASFKSISEDIYQFNKILKAKDFKTFFLKSIVPPYVDFNEN